ncbi:MAG: hypothetical protein ACKPJD_08575, partial [Planctomycetaceae bacterium]
MTTSFDKDLLLAIAQRKLVPFVGAGASLAVNKSQALKKFPSWKELLELLLSQLKARGTTD